MTVHLSCTQGQGAEESYNIDLKQKEVEDKEDTQRTEEMPQIALAMWDQRFPWFPVSF